MNPLWTVRYGTIKIPHLNYTVKVQRYKHNPTFKGDVAGWVLLEGDGSGATLFLKARATPMLVAHELTHVLQHICQVRHMNFQEEVEHTAYIMQYVMGLVFGYKWSPSP